MDGPVVDAYHRSTPGGAGASPVRTTSGKQADAKGARADKRHENSLTHFQQVIWRTTGWRPRADSASICVVHHSPAIWSGGQTGVDRAALDVALECGLVHGGWIPRGRIAEDGAVPARYAALREAESADYGARTFLNVRDTDATLILRWGPATSGTLATIECVRQLGKPFLELDLAVTDSSTAATAVEEWLEHLGPVSRLNIAGPRASTAPLAYGHARDVLRRVFARD